MNIKKGDIVQHKRYREMQGQVVRVYFDRFRRYEWDESDESFGCFHTVAFHGGGGDLKFRDPNDLRVIRRVK